MQCAHWGEKPYPQSQNNRINSPNLAPFFILVRAKHMHQHNEVAIILGIIFSFFFILLSSSFLLNLQERVIIGLQKFAWAPNSQKWQQKWQVATKELCAARLDNIDRKLVVKVGGKDVTESKDEKLLGMIMSNDLTWHTHLYGNKLKGKDKLVGSGCSPS